MQTLMVVTCDAAGSRDDALNRWYSWVHIRDVMKLRGSISVQRFVASPVQPAVNTPFGNVDRKYLTLYEVGDKEACTQSHKMECFTEKMPVSKAFDFDAFYEAYYDPVDGRGQSYAGGGHNNAVMLIGFNAAEDGATPEALLYAGEPAQVAKIPGFASATLFRFGTGQMMDLTPTHNRLMVCHLSDASLAVASWDRFAAAIPPSAGLHARVYLPLMARLHAGDVVSGAQPMASISAEERAALGADVHGRDANQHM